MIVIIMFPSILFYNLTDDSLLIWLFYSKPIAYTFCFCIKKLAWAQLKYLFYMAHNKTSIVKGMFGVFIDFLKFVNMQEKLKSCIALCLCFFQHLSDNHVFNLKRTPKLSTYSGYRQIVRRWPFGVLETK